MSGQTTSATRRVSRSDDLPGYVYHPSFDERAARQTYLAQSVLTDTSEYQTRYMPDEVTRDHARRMHYAAYRAHGARARQEVSRWRRTCFDLRDRIVLGNLKLVYRAVRRRMAQSNRADDLIGDCQIVLIQAVAAFNPWLEIRFSTYAYTCLVRALARLSQRMSTDWLSRSLSLDAIPDGEPRMPYVTEPTSGDSFRLDEYLRDDHPLLSDREKTIISRRFALADEGGSQTLEKVGRDLGLSKERVRQVQASALGKLRQVLAPVAARSGE